MESHERSWTERNHLAFLAVHGQGPREPELFARGAPRASSWKRSASAWSCPSRARNRQRRRMPRVGKRDKALPDAELERRLKALQAAKAREAEDEERRAVEERGARKERTRAPSRRGRGQGTRKSGSAKKRSRPRKWKTHGAKADEEARRNAPPRGGTRRRRGTPPPTSRCAAPAVRAPTPVAAQGRRRLVAAAGRGADRGGERRSGKLTVNQALTGGEGGRQRSLAAMKRKQERARQKAMGGAQDREKGRPRRAGA